MPTKPEGLVPLTQLVHAVMLSPTLPGTLGRYLPIMAIHVKAHDTPLSKYICSWTGIKRKSLKL